jgi:hypothetical protein
MDGHGGSAGVLHHGEGQCGLVAGAVGGGDGQGSAEGVVGVEGIGVRAGCSGRAAQAVSSPGAGRLGEGQVEEVGQRVVNMALARGPGTGSKLSVSVVQKNVG